MIDDPEEKKTLFEVVFAFLFVIEFHSSGYLLARRGSTR